jgi:hypothetical protein
MAARWCQATPGQDGDGMARNNLPGQDACHQVLEGGPPTHLTATHVFLSLGVRKRESVPASPWKHGCFEEES